MRGAVAWMNQKKVHDVSLGRAFFFFAKFLMSSHTLVHCSQKFIKFQNLFAKIVLLWGDENYEPIPSFHLFLILSEMVENSSC